ncbi:MAG TPA: hypothetical protein VMV15_11120 [Candidatus Binataceae bacterium]|nr:hypothetical protein [Candidatus Binataceae bacterium]
MNTGQKITDRPRLIDGFGKGAAAISIAVAMLLGFAPFASAAKFKNSSFKGRYICRVQSDGTYENSVIILTPNGRGGLSGSKTLVSADFFCARPAGSSVPCACAYSVDSGSTYAVNLDGSATAQLTWDAAGSNNGACPGNFTDDWNFVLGGGGNSAVVTDDNNGNSSPSGPWPGFGDCTKTSAP